MPDSVTFVEDEDADSRPLRELLRIAGGACFDCAAKYSARECVFSIALGFKAAARCLSCLTRRLGRNEAELREQLDGYVARQECYRRAWRVAEQMDDNPATDAAPMEAWDAGDLACGELVLALRNRLTALPPGALFTLRATDPAAPEDLPAWCRLCGHTLVSADHPEYVIRRKDG
jgi:tRNA 2-thiouridine synthesizing protein A